MAEHLGAVSTVQATLAHKKIAKLGRYRKPTRVSIGKAEGHSVSCWDHGSMASLLVRLC